MRIPLWAYSAIRAELSLLKEGNKGIGKAKHGTVQHRRQRQRGTAAQQKQPFCPGHLIFAVSTG